MATINSYFKNEDRSSNSQFITIIPNDPSCCMSTAEFSVVRGIFVDAPPLLVFACKICDYVQEC